MEYFWQLDKRHKGEETVVPHFDPLWPPEPGAEFLILGEAGEAEISRVRRDWGDSHLVLGVLYARAGLLQEAEQELRALRQQNPGSGAVAGLLASVERQHAVGNRSTACPDPHQTRLSSGVCVCQDGWKTDPTTFKCVKR
jgi:hypothetical protein